MHSFKRMIIEGSTTQSINDGSVASMDSLHSSDDDFCLALDLILSLADRIPVRIFHYSIFNDNKKNNVKGLECMHACACIHGRSSMVQRTVPSPSPTHDNSRFFHALLSVSLSVSVFLSSSSSYGASVITKTHCDIHSFITTTTRSS